MKVYGFLEKAQLENVSTDLSNTLLGLIWYNTTDNKAKIYNGSVDSIVTEAATQTLTNKTISGGTITGAAISGGSISGVDINLGIASNTNKFVPSQDTRANLEALTREAGSFYYVTDESKYLGDDGLNLFEIGSGSGEGINYTINPDFETNANDHVAYKDSASEVPDDATGGSPTLAVARSTVDPLVGNASGVITKPASNVQGEGIKIASEDFDNAYKGRVVLIRLEYDASADEAQDGDFRLFFKDETNNEIIRVDNEDIVAKKGQHTAFVQVPSNCDNGSIVVHCATDHTDGYDFKYDKVSIGPTSVSGSSSIVSDWISYTPNVTYGAGGATNVTHTGQYRRVGDSIEVRIRSEFSAASAAFTSPLYSLPGGLSLDTNKIMGTANTFYGLLRVVDAASNSFLGDVQYSSDDRVFANVHVSSGTSTGTFASLSNTFPFTIGAGDFIELTFTAPIVGWEAGVSPNEVVSGREIHARFQQNSTQSIPDNVKTKININAISDDTVGGLDLVNDEYVVQESGVYHINGYSAMEGANQTVNNGRAILNVAINGVSQQVLGIDDSSTLSGYSLFNISGARDYKLNKGDVLTFEIEHNTGANRNLLISEFSITRNNSLNSQAVPVAPVAARYTTDSGQSIPFNTTTTILFEDKDYDTHDAYNPLTGIYTVPLTGKYQINCGFYYTPLPKNAGERALSIISVDATNVSFSSLQTVNPTGNVEYFVGHSEVLDLVRGQEIAIQTTHNFNAAAHPLSAVGAGNFFSIAKVGN